MDKEQTQKQVSVLDYNDKLKSIRLKNLSTLKIKNELTKQLDTVSIALGQHLSRFDRNKNGIIDLFENEKTRYLIEDLPSVKETKTMIGHIEDYLVMKEKEISLLVEALEELFVISDSAVSQPMSIPVVKREDNFDATLAFEKKIRLYANNFKNATRADDRYPQKITAIDASDSTEKKFITNKVWMEIVGEYLFKEVTTEKDYSDGETNGS